MRQGARGGSRHVKRRQCRVAAGPGKRGRFAAVGVGFGAFTRTRPSLPRGDAQRQRESPPSKDRCWRDTHWAAQRAGERSSERCEGQVWGIREKREGGRIRCRVINGRGSE